MTAHGFGIVGCGMIAEYHARAIGEIDGARVVSAYSRTTANGAKVAEIAAAKGPCAVVDRLDDLLCNDEVDVVCVCTPSGAHLEPGVAAARAGKHVVVEKPLEVNLSRCDALIRACDAAGVRLCTIFPSRYGEANRRLKAAIEAGRFGRLTLGDSHVKWWRTQAYYDSAGWRGTWDLDGGGALMNQGIHNVDLLAWLMGEVESVQATAATLAHTGIEVEDTIVATLRFRSGALGVFEAATSAYPGLPKRIEIHGDRGSARVEQDAITLWDFAEPADEDESIRAGLLDPGARSSGAADPKGIDHEGHRRQLADFLRAIDGAVAPAIDGREGRRSVEVVRAIYRAARDGRAVALPLLDD